MLEEYSNDTTGDRVLVINGNKEDQFPNIDFIKDQIVSTKIIVDSVAITQKADPELFTISQLTGELHK